MSAANWFERLLTRLIGARQIALLAVHAFIFGVSYVFAWLLRFDFALSPASVDAMRASILPVVLIQLGVFTAFGMLRGWWRYVGMSDAIRLGATVTAATVLLFGTWYASDALNLTLFDGVSRAVLLIDWAFALLGLFGTRVAIRTLRDMTRANSEQVVTRRVLIAGAGDAGEALLREIQHRPQLGMKVLAFVDDDERKWGSAIRGTQIRGPIASLADIARDSGADEVLLAMPSAPGRRIREIVRDLAGAGVSFRTMPGLDQLVSGKVQVTQLRPVNVDDLVRREKIVVAPERVRALFAGKRIVVTGAGGSIGSELALHILDSEPAELHLIERSELALYNCESRLLREKPWAKEVIVTHLRDCERSERLIAKIQPSIVIHAAAHKHVPLGQQNPAEYVRNNCVVTRRFAEACEAAGVERFVFISTDKAVHPISAMGASKRAAEIALLDLAARATMRIMVVRFGNIIGSSGSVVPRFIEQIAAGGPVTVTHPDATRYFLRTSEAISLVLQAAALGEGGHTYMLDMGEPVRIADLARDLIQLSNHTLDEIPIVYTGLRSGEKLEENVWSDAEVVTATDHPHIMAIQSAAPLPFDVPHWYQQLEASVAVDSPSVNELLAAAMPVYTSPQASSAQAVPLALQPSASSTRFVH